MINKLCDNCKTCDTVTGHCSECNTGYNIQGNNCVMDKSCDNCKTCDTVTGHCSDCNTGYNLQENNCVIDCLDKDDKGCHTCDIGFYNNNGVCTNIGRENCEVGNSIKCIACKQGYYPNPHGQITGSTCVQCSMPDENCILCNSLGCVVCAKGYTVNSQSKKCESCVIPDGCAQCDNTGCIKCEEGYIRKKVSGTETFFCEKAVPVELSSTFVKRTYDTNKACDKDNDKEYLAHRFPAAKPYPKGGNWEQSGWCAKTDSSHTLYKPDPTNKDSPYTSNKETIYNHKTNTYENVFVLPCENGWDPVSVYGLPDSTTTAEPKTDYTTSYHDMLYCKKRDDKTS